MIESVNNERVKYYKKLREKKYILKEKKYIVEGEHLVEEAIKKGLCEEIILLYNKEYKTNLKVTTISEKVLQNISTLDTPQYVLGVVRLEENKTIGNRIVILDGVQDPGNAGTIIRNAVAFNADTIIFNESSVFPYNDKVVRATQGMLYNINIINMNLDEAFKEIKKKNIKIFGTSMKGTKLEEINKEDNYALILGSEGSGMSEYSFENSDELINIEMNKSCESLNVGVSSGIILYKFR